MIKKTIAMLVMALGFALGLGAQQMYSLPKTSIALEVETVVETFHAGPYAEYAKKYLGIEVRGEDSVSSHISSITLVPHVEADLSATHTIQTDAPSLLSLSSQGLVCVPSDVVSSRSLWRFPAAGTADFETRGVTSNFANETTSLYKSAEDGSTIVVTQNMLVEKSLDKRAAEAADMVLMLRKTRVQIITGDTDMTYSGEAMGAAVEEMTRLEKEYLSLFTGYTESRTQTALFEIVPEAGKQVQKYVAFRLSDSQGAVAPDNISGSPIVIEFVPEDLAVSVAVDAADGQGTKNQSLKPAKNMEEVHCRIPAVCAVRLYDGTSMLMSARIPVYQLGAESLVYVKKH